MKCNQYKHNHTERFLGLKICHWWLISFLLILFFLIGGLYQLYDMVIYRPNHPPKLASPVGNIFNMVAYADDGKQPKFPLADLPERARNIALITKIWGKDSPVGTEIAICESGLRTNAYHNNTNNTQDQGIFQINSVHGMPDMFDAVANISYAYTLYVKQGLAPWESSRPCWSTKI